MPVVESAEPAPASSCGFLDDRHETCNCQPKQAGTVTPTFLAGLRL